MPAESGEKRIEMSIEGDDTIIRLSGWVDGLGWCGEKTMRIEPEMLDDLHRMIAAARVRVKSRDVEENGMEHWQNVLTFPVSKAA